jgi:hypothetical protein
MFLFHSSTNSGLHTYFLRAVYFTKNLKLVGGQEGDGDEKKDQSPSTNENYNSFSST